MKKLLAATFLTFAALSAEDAPQKPASAVVDAKEELREALIKGDLVKLEEILAKDKTAANWEFRNGYTPLMFATARGDEKAVLKLLTAGADVHARSDNGKTALMLSAMVAKDGGLKAAELLIEAGARVDDRTPDTQMTALHLSITRLNIEMTKFLLDNGANPNATYISRVQKDNAGDIHYVRGYTALMLAADSGDAALNTALILLNKGADVNQKNEMGATAFEHAQAYAPKIANLLKSKVTKKPQGGLYFSF